MVTTYPCDDTRQSSVVHGIRVDGPSALLAHTWRPRMWTMALTTTVEVTQELTDVEHSLSGELVALQRWCQTTEYAFARDGHLLHFVFPDFCAGVADLERGTLSLRAKSVADASLVFPNTILSAALGPEPDVVLHASAVSRRGQTIGICGTSGAGKSSLATALTLARYAIVSDDALRIRVTEGGDAICFPGVPELRLRQTRNWQLPTARLRTLPDERIGFLPELYESDETALRALVFPVVSPENRKPSLERLKGERAMEQLLRASRIAWTSNAGARFFRRLARLHQVVPVYALHLSDAFLDSATHIEQLSGILDDLGTRS
jgi:hypothetical protein